MADKAELTNQLRRLRFDHLEMTQEELAREVGVTRQTIIAIESGRYAPSLPLAMRLARVFGRAVEEVFSLAVSAGESDLAPMTAPQPARRPVPE